MATVDKHEDGRARRMDADARREQVVDIALREFAAGGLHGTATDDIARRAGITQPYVFRLFGTKKELFLASIERCFERTRSVMEAAAEATPAGGDVLQAMGSAYGELLRDRELLLAQMQAYAACGDPDVQELVRRRYGELWEMVERLSGADADAVREFFAMGMLLNVAAAMDLGRHRNHDWVARCLG